MKANSEIFLVAGEPSGDLHAAHLVRTLLAQRPDLKVCGFGGPRLASVGMDVQEDLASDAIMGIFPVIAALPRIKRLMNQAEAYLREHRPAALLLVDYPGFNIRLAARAHRLGIPVIYYISPQVWAWAQWRIKKLARIVDLMLVILPFEKEAYRGSGLRTEFVGHPLMDHLRSITPSEEQISAVCGTHEGPILGIFPGSRGHVIRSLSGVFLEALAHLRTLPGAENTKGIIALSNERFRKDVERHTQKEGAPPTEIIEGRPYEVMAASDIALTTSGTSTLEIAAFGTPFVLGYRTSPVMYGLGRMLIRVPHIGLINLVAEKGIVPEHIGVRSFARAAAEDLHALLTDDSVRATQIKALNQVRDRLDTKGSYERAAGLILNQLDQR